MAESSNTDSTADDPPPLIESWADEAEEESTSSSTKAGVTSLNVEGLTVDENKRPPKLLDDPDDSNIQAVTSGDTPYTSAARFEDLNISPEVLEELYVGMMFKKPIIQPISLPMILSQNPPHRDLIAQTLPGCGKTTGVVLGMLSCVDPKLQAPQALCICATREWAFHNTEALRRMGRYTGISSECAVPRKGLSIYKRPPITAQVVIGTPGTVKKWMSAKKLGATRLKILVFDEADQMLAEDGFKDESLRIKKRIEKVNSNCQVLLFSEIFNDTVKNFVSRVVREDHNSFLFDR